MKLPTDKKQVIALGFALVALLSYNFITAYDESKWFPPAGLPPTQNIAMPINTGSSSQVKAGDLGVGNTLALFGASPNVTFISSIGFPSMWVLRSVAESATGSLMQFRFDRDNSGGTGDDGRFMPFALFAGASSSDDYAKFSNQVRSKQYCDSEGENCFSAAAVGPATGNQITYLKRNRILFDSTYFIAPGEVVHEFDFKQAGYPPNMVRVYLAVNRQKRLATDMPQVNIIAPVTNNSKPVGNDNDYSSGIKGDWYSVKDGYAKFNANCFDAFCGKGDTRNYLDIRVYGFECSGPCQDPVGSGGGILSEKMYSCTVDFVTNLNGSVSNATRRIFGDKGDSFGIALGYQGNNKDSNNPWQPFSEQLASNSWGASMWSHSDRAIGGYFDVQQYAENKATINRTNLREWERYSVGTVLLESERVVNISESPNLYMQARVRDCNE